MGCLGEKPERQTIEGNERKAQQRQRPARKAEPEVQKNVRERRIIVLAVSGGEYCNRLVHRPPRGGNNAGLVLKDGDAWIRGDQKQPVKGQDRSRFRPIAHRWFPSDRRPRRDPSKSGSVSEISGFCRGNRTDSARRGFLDGLARSGRSARQR